MSDSYRFGERLKAPFPWFGGKRKVAPQVWRALGNVDNYIEPFAGSLAVLLGRPRNYGKYRTGAETVNDKDAFLANFWRALSAVPDEVAHYADWPINEADLFARHLWLVNSGRERIVSMDADPDFYDPKVAGWWVWGLCAWIGSGWCSGKGPWQLPHLGDAGRGVNRQLPLLGNVGQGVNRQLPHLANAGLGVNRQLPHLGDAGRGILEYMQELSVRLRRVRVCCGDWSRVVTDGAMSYGASVGVFLDPPYLGEVRTADLYSVDDHSIANAVREWALAHGDDPRFRIVLAGYDAEHAEHMPDSWRVESYVANRAYGTKNGTDSANVENRKKERLWYSPHCLGKQKRLL